MPLSMKLLMVAAVPLVVLVVFLDQTLARMLCAVVIVLIGAAFVSYQESQQQRVESFQKELDRINRIC